MKSTTIAFASLLASAAMAQPRRQHQHQHQHQHAKKAAEVVWVTDWVSTTEIVQYTTTVWVEAGAGPPPSAAPQSPSTATVAVESTPTPAPAQFFEAAQKNPKPSSSTSTHVAPAPTYVAPEVQAAAPVVVKSSSSSVNVPPTTPAAAYTPPAVSSAAAPASSAPVASGGSGGSHGAVVPSSPLPGSGHNGIGTGIVTPTCGTAGLPDCAGDITYYEAADSPKSPSGCGTVNDGNTEHVVALSKDMMGPQSNSGVGDDANPYCGKTVTIVWNGKTTTAKVVDKCWDCNYQSIDLSHAAFNALTPDYTTLGRQPATWYFN